MVWSTELIIIVSVFGAAWLLVFVLALTMSVKISRLQKTVAEMQVTGRLRVQKLTMKSDKNHAFHNPTISPDEELSKRGYSMYTNDADLESGRETERQTGGQFVEDLTREIESRQQRQNTTTAPPFLLQSIEENKRKSRNLANPVSKGRESNTNSNFIY